MALISPLVLGPVLDRLGSVGASPLSGWTGNNEIEGRRTKISYETKSGTFSGRDEIDTDPNHP
ncbi:hypothetical protein HNR46_003402 [Haloferula luteola]|uniref:Uncharacterized protein n=1 Tax=Haloferula luteola TaxID=595692 RepID=A0A840VEU1_9BACT|nr:hypothetical protein [Haloferula luteola]